MTFASAVALVLIALLLAGIVYQQIGLAIDRKRVRPFGQIIRAPGGSLRMNRVGAGDITVVLESRMAASALSWARVESDIAKFAKRYRRDLARCSCVARSSGRRSAA